MKTKYIIENEQLVKIAKMLDKKGLLTDDMQMILYASEFIIENTYMGDIEDDELYLARHFEYKRRYLEGRNNIIDDIGTIIKGRAKFDMLDYITYLYASKCADNEAVKYVISDMTEQYLDTAKVIVISGHLKEKGIDSLNDIISEFKESLGDSWKDKKNYEFIKNCIIMYLIRIASEDISYDWLYKKRGTERIKEEDKKIAILLGLADSIVKECENNGNYKSFIYDLLECDDLDIKLLKEGEYVKLIDKILADSGYNSYSKGLDRCVGNQLRKYRGNELESIDELDKELRELNITISKTYTEDVKPSDISGYSFEDEINLFLPRIYKHDCNMYIIYREIQEKMNIRDCVVPRRSCYMYMLIYLLYIDKISKFYDSIDYKDDEAMNCLEHFKCVFEDIVSGKRDLLDYMIKCGGENNNLGSIFLVIREYD